MGVFCDVHVCVRAEAPLEVERRALAVQVCQEHGLLSGVCRLVVPSSSAAIAPPGLWHRFVALFRKKDAHPKQAAFVESALSAYGSLSDPSMRLVEEAQAGPWLSRRASETATDFAVGCQGPRWKGEPVDGGFSYLAASRPFHVYTSNAYRQRGEPRNPHVREDGDVGSFFDVLTFSCRTGPDGRAMASSSFVRDLKKKLDVKVTCRASWW